MSLAFLAIATMIGCNDAIHQYAASLGPPPSSPPASRAPTAVPHGPSGLTLTPGAVTSNAAPLSLRANVNTNERDYAVGGDQKAHLSISWSQTSL